MEGLDTLLRKRWILKSEDKELYYKVRDELGEIRQFASEKMGCQIVCTSPKAFKDVRQIRIGKRTAAILHSNKNTAFLFGKAD